MEQLAGKVGVVTGAASGIGLAVAQRFAAEGMRVVLADVEEGPLTSAVAELVDDGAEAIGVPTDVSDGSRVEALAAAAVDAFGMVHVVHNNAGVVTGGPIEQLTIDDWKWVLGVDLWSVIYGIRSFLPLIRQAGEGHIVNTASTAGLQSAPGIAPYNVAKFGVVALSETLALELADEPDINASVLCPGAVDTQIVESGRNRPDDLADHESSEVDDEFRRRSAEVIAQGMAPADVAELVVDSIRTKRFWIVTHEPWKQIMVDRAAALAADGSLHTAFGG